MMESQHEKSPMPRIGIFWDVDGELVSEAIPVTDAPLTNGIRDSDANHHYFWKQWTRKKSRFRSYSYDHFPRGRIVYREADQIFVIFGDRCLIANEQFAKQLQETFGLPPEQCEVKSDFHYQCRRCNPIFVSDF